MNKKKIIADEANCAFCRDPRPEILQRGRERESYISSSPLLDVRLASAICTILAFRAHTENLKRVPFYVADKLDAETLLLTLPIREGYSKVMGLGAC